MIKVGVTEVSTFLEPSAAASTATEFAGFLGNTALGASFTADNLGCTRRPGQFCGHVGVE